MRRMNRHAPLLALVSLISLLFVLAACSSTEPEPPVPPIENATHPTGDVVTSVPIDGRPYGVAVSPTGEVFVALIGSNTLATGQLDEMTFPDRIEVGLTPPHVAVLPDGSHAFATLQTGRGVAVVDAAGSALVATVPLSSDGFNLIASPNRPRVYATTAEGLLYVLDATTYAVIETLPVGSAANGLAFNPDASILYVSSRDAGTITAIRTSNNRILRTYTVGGQPQRIAASPDRGVLFIANEVSGLDVLFLQSGKVRSYGFGGPAYGLGITPDGEQLYVLLSAGEVRILDRATLAPIKTITVGAPARNVAFDRRGTTALVTNEASVTFIR